MTLRIAFCGPNFELCSKMATSAFDLLYKSDLNIVTLPNPIIEVVQRTSREEWESKDTDWFNTYVMSIRRMDMGAAASADVVISESCGIDQVAVQAAYLGELMTSTLQLSLPSIEAAEERDAMINRSGSVLQVLLNAAEEDVVEYWDFVYAILPVATGISVAPDVVLTQYADFLTSAPAFRDVVRLSDNETSALDGLSSEVEKWKAKIAS